MESTASRGKGLHSNYFLLLPIFFLVANLCMYPAPLDARKFINSFAGPYFAYVEKWRHCAPKSSDDTITADVRPSMHRPHFRKRQTITGNLTFHSEFNDSYWMTIRYDAWSNNQWKENAMLLKFPSGACKSFRVTFPSFYYVVMNDSTPVPASAPCRVSPGVRSFDNEPILWYAPPMPVLPYGLFRFHLVVGLKDANKGCTELDLHILPKTDTSPQ